MTKTDGNVTEELTKKSEQLTRSDLLGEIVALTNSIEDYAVFKQKVLSMLLDSVKLSKG